MNCSKCLMPIKRTSTGQKTLGGMVIMKWVHKATQPFCKKAEPMVN